MMENQTIIIVTTTTTTTTPSPGPQQMLSKQTETVFTVVNVVVLSELISLFGIFTNTITIIVLGRQGFQRTINISLMGMAVSDLLSLVSLACLCVGNNPWLIDSSVPFDPIGVFYLTTGWPNTAFARITGWITAFIAVERCLCVAMPLKIKSVLTHGRSLFIIVCIYVGVIAGVAPIYWTAALDSKFDVAKNKTVVALSLIGANRDEIKRVALSINNVFSPFTSFGLVIVCTAVLAIKLHGKSKWRKTVTRNFDPVKTPLPDTNISTEMKYPISVKDTGSVNQKPEVSEKSKDPTGAKDMKVIKLVVALSSIYIVSSVPAVLHYFWMILDPQYTVVGRQSNVHLSVAGITFVFQAANSSVNMFVYLTMSSSFRDVFYTLPLFRACGRQAKKM
ncbi:uncharacterized protein LOC131938623 [Physella acuta]|uniref:uncharacterized protein LOC131938623 n=1 Tax=Physella acuta TaxID=109671 RepID=UPI0027DB09D0|nr:uncharacterized protein LOC131938623 [Physella acuta]